MGQLENKKTLRKRQQLWQRMISLLAVIAALDSSPAQGTKTGREYQRPKWKQLLELMKNWKYNQLSEDGIVLRSTISWGRPSEGRFVSYRDCPSLPVPPGAAAIFCDGSTCVVECLPGYHPAKGDTRTQCKGRKDKFGTWVRYWTTSLTKCITCEEPFDLQDNVRSFCYVNPGTNEKICDISCANGGQVRYPALKGGAVRCKCNSKTERCYWSRKKGKNRPIIPSEMRCATFNTAGQATLTSQIGQTKPMGCGAKPTQCQKIDAMNAYFTTGLTIEPSWSCPNCFRLNGGFKVPDYFDKRDWIDVKFSQSVSRFSGTLFPLKTAAALDEGGQTWRFTFNSRATFRNRWLKWRSEFVSDEFDVSIESISLCPCSTDQNVPMSWQTGVGPLDRVGPS